MTVRLFSELRSGYMSANDTLHLYNVDLAQSAGPAEEWVVTALANGNYALKNVALGRYLDADRFNVDTSPSLRSDDEWTFELVPDKK